MKSTGTSTDTITGWSVLFFCSSPLSSSPFVCVWVLSLMTQRLWRHAVTADGRYLKKKKKKDRKGWNHLRTTRATPRERENLWLVGTDRKGHKLWPCSNIPFTELHSPLFNFPISRQIACLFWKKCRALLFFQRLHHRKPQVREPELFITITVRSFSGATGKLSVIWQRLYYSTPCGSVGVAFAQNSYEKKQRQGLVPRRRFLKPGSQSGGAKRQCG